MEKVAGMGFGAWAMGLHSALTAYYAHSTVYTLEEDGSASIWKI